MDKIPSILEVKGIWTSTEILDSNHKKYQEQLDGLLSRIFWNPSKEIVPQDYKLMEKNLILFIANLNALHDVYQNVFNFLAQYYPEVFINGPK